MVKLQGHLAALAALASTAAAGGWQSPVYPDNAFYSVPLPKAQDKAVKYTFTSPTTGQPIDYYEVDIKPLFRKQYPNLGPARMLGYDGQIPGKASRSHAHAFIR